VSDAIGDAAAGGDAFEGSGGDVPPDPADSSNNEGSSSLPGFNMNVGVAGAYASPVGDAPSVAHGDLLEMQANQTSGTGGDGFSVGMDPQQQAAMAASNLGLANGMLGNARTSIGQAAAQQQQAQAQGPQPMGPPGQQQGAPQPQQAGGQQGGGPGGAGKPPPPINQVSLGASGGFLTADLTYADQSLVSAVAAAASGAGRQAALMAGTVSLSGMHLSAGGSSRVGSRNAAASDLVFGSESGGAPQFGGGGHWFGPTVQAWAAANPPPVKNPPPPQQGDGGGGGPMTPAGQAAVADPAVADAVNRSLGQWQDQSGGHDSGDAVDNHYETPAQENYGTGFNDSVWSDMGPGVSTVGQDQHAAEMGGGGQADEMGTVESLGGIYTKAQDDARGANTPGPGFNSLGGSEGGNMESNTAEQPGALSPTNQALEPDDMGSLATWY
jgi:hypothetical protein